MEINTSAFSAGVSGVNKSLKGIERAAHEIASLNTQADGGELSDVVGALVDLKKHELGVKASAMVIKTASEMAATIIDIKV